MSLIAVVHVEHHKLALAPTIEAVPAVEIRVVTNCMTDPETEMFFFQVQHESGDFDEFEVALDRDETVSDPLVVSESETTRMYRFKHLSDTELLSPKITELGGLVIEATAAQAGWRLRMQLPNRGTIEELWEYCSENEISFELCQISDNNADSASATNVSEEQRTALIEAYRNGYFQEPRKTSQSDLAEQFDIGPTAIGGRLRRGTRQLVEDMLLDDNADRQG